jgi:hypothetical protein
VENVTMQSSTPPTRAATQQAVDMPILDKDGQKTSLKAISAAKGGQKLMVVFIRHFFCGVS